MPRRRDRGFLDALELWRPRAPTPEAVPAAFVTIARIFQQVDCVMLDEMRANTKERSDSRFNSDTDAFRDKDVTDYITTIEEITLDTSSEARVSAYLRDCYCTTAWGRVHSAVLERQGDSKEHHSLRWIQARSRANELLDLAKAVLETYDSDECQDLLIPGREGVGAGIEAKLRKLLSFNTIYSRPTYENERAAQPGPGNHNFYALFNDFTAERRENTKAKRRVNYARIHQNRDVSLVTATTFAVAISAIPLGVAFHKSTNNAPGSTSDSDFWLLIENSLMQILGLITTTLISIVPRPREPHIWVWPKFLIGCIAVLGLDCALAAPVLYVRFCPIYSAVVSFMASAAQACMVLQLALFVDVSKGREKVD